MRKHKRMSLDCFGSQRLCKILTLLGGGEALLCLYLYDWSGSNDFLMATIVGFLLLAAGLAVSWLGIVCPRCGAPLYEFPRLPRHIPQYCPRCGDEITPEKDD